MRLAVLGLSAALLAAACSGSSSTPTADQPAEQQADSTVPATSAAPATTAGRVIETRVSGDPLPPFEGMEGDAAIGRSSPIVVAPDLLTGAEVRIEAQGRPMAIAFYAHWCPHCQAEVTELTEWQQSDSLPEGVDFYAVSVFEDPNATNHPPADWFAAEGWQHPVVADTAASEISQAFGVQGVPFLVVVSADNTVALRVSGNMGPNQLVGLFQQLIAAGS